jgi:fumarate hydratase class II
MARHERQFWRGEFPVDDVQIGSTDAAGMNVNEYLAGPGTA